MKRPFKLLRILSSGAAMLLMTSICHAQVLLSVDFGTTTSAVQTGYSAFGIGTGSTGGPITKSYTGVNSSYTSGTVGITLATGTTLVGTGTFTARDRNAPATDAGTFTYSSVYRDFVNTTANGTMTIGLTGLNANTTYSLTLYAYDNSNSRTMTFTDFTTGSAGSSGSITWTAASTFDATTPNSIFSTTISVTSDATGALIIRDTPTGSSPALINGLQLIAVPEPSIAALLTASLGFVIITRKRRAVV